MFRAVLQMFEAPFAVLQVMGTIFFLLASVLYQPPPESPQSSCDSTDHGQLSDLPVKDLPDDGVIVNLHARLWRQKNNNNKSPRMPFCTNKLLTCCSASTSRVWWHFHPQTDFSASFSKLIRRLYGFCLILNPPEKFSEAFKVWKNDGRCFYSQTRTSSDLKIDLRVWKSSSRLVRRFSDAFSSFIAFET